MKTASITTIILEGANAVGKSTVLTGLQKIYRYRYMIYHRGDMSNMVYAEKYHRFPALTQVGLPCLHVLLTCSESVLKSRIMHRQTSEEEKQQDLEAIYELERFEHFAECMKNDYHVIVVDTSLLSVQDTVTKVYHAIEQYVKALPVDDNISEWNKMYDKACKSLGLTFSCRGNQPYINDIPFMSESTLQNGVYEQFGNKAYPDNFIYSLAYDITEEAVDCIPKTVDFAYVINSKINRRPEIYEYYDVFAGNNKTCIVSESLPMLQNHPNRRWFRPVPRTFGNDFIREIAPAKATVYCGKDLAYLKLQTARLYEAIIAKQLVFVDYDADPDIEMMSAIHPDSEIACLMMVTPSTIIDKYDYIMSNPDVYHLILDNQTKYYYYLKSIIKGGLFCE